MSYLIIGGTNFAVGQMPGGTNVGGTYVCGTFAVGQKSRHRIACIILLHYCNNFWYSTSTVQNVHDYKVGESGMLLFEH
jgi:hypothetical protein